MTVSLEQLQRELNEARAMPNGAPKFERLDAVLRHADAAGHDQFAFETRVQVLDDFNYGGDYRRALRTFGEALAVLDNRPELVSQWTHYLLMWAFKWMLPVLVEFPDIELSHITRVAQQMEQHYRTAGYSMHAVHQHWMLVNVRTGNHEEAQRAHDRLLAAKRDRMSDCAVCVPADLVEFYAETGQWEAAVSCAERHQHLRCRSQPQWLLSHALRPYVETGKAKLAAKAHRRVYPKMRDRSTWLSGIGEHLVLCALTGNDARGLEIVQRHLSWLDTSPSPLDTMEFASGAALVLSRLAETGRGDEVVRDRRSGRPDETSVADLRDELVGTAQTIAAQLDQRNGNDYHTRRLGGRLNLEPVTTDLVL